MDNQPLPPFIGRLSGGILFLAGLAAGSQLVSYWSDASWPGRLGLRFGFYAVAGGLSLLAVVQGLRMVTAHRGSDLSLPRHLLAFGALLLLLTGVAQIVLLFALPSVGSLDSAISIGIGGGLAALRLWRHRKDTPDSPDRWRLTSG